MSKLDIDGLIERLEEMKKSGILGNTPVAFLSADNSGRRGYVERVEAVGMVPVAKSDMDKEYSLCRIVTARGVPIAVIR